jgi:hypothetical protein
MIPRSGDISSTGIFFQTDLDIGGVGTVQWLHIASADKAKSAAVMAHVVRQLRVSDIEGDLTGVALEFMPENDESAERLAELVRYILEVPQASGGKRPSIAPRVEATAPAASGSTSVKELSINTMVLETDWSVPVGEAVRVEIIAKGVRRPIRVEGQAVSVKPTADNKRFSISVEVRQEISGPLRRFSEQAMPAMLAPQPKASSTPKPPPSERKVTASSQLENLLSALTAPPAEPPARKHLVGNLARIPFPALCTLIDSERLTGTLAIRRPRGVVRLFVKDGRFVDMEPSGTDVMQDLVSVFESRDGSFEMDVRSVERADRIKCSMTNLLLEIARLSDESKPSSRRGF